MSLRASIVKRSLLKEAVVQQMYQLYTQYYTNLTENQFLKDLLEKQLVILQKDQQDKIAGFSTVQIIVTNIENKEYLFLYSGDTVVDSRFWQQSTLAGAFTHILFRIIHTYADLPRFWFLISKGFRTYRYLPVFFKCFYPAYNEQTPFNYQKLLDQIASIKFKEKFNERTGVISFDGQKDYLKPDYAKIPIVKMNDPHIKFFVQKNPFFFRGDELACLAEISTGNFKRQLFKIFRNTKVEWYE